MQSAPVIKEFEDHMRVDLVGGIGGTLGFRKPPPGTPQRGQEILADALSHFLATNDRAKALKSTPHVTVDDEFQAEALAPAISRTEKGIETGMAELLAWSAKIAKAEEELYTPPPAKDGNQDQEARADYHRLDAARRVKVLREMQRGEHREMLHAIVRGITPSEGRDRAMEVWRVVVEKEKETEIAKILGSGPAWMRRSPVSLFR